MFHIAFGVPQGFEYLVKLLGLEIVFAARWDWGFLLDGNSCGGQKHWGFLVCFISKGH